MIDLIDTVRRHRDMARKERDAAWANNQALRKALLAVLDENTRRHPDDDNTPGVYQAARELLRRT